MTMSAQWPDRDKRDTEILRRHYEGASARRISSEMGIARNTVTRTLVSNDIDLQVTAKQSRLGVRKELPLTGPELAEAYNAGATVKALARQCHVSPYTIRTRLTDEGVEIRSSGLPHELPERLIAAEYVHGGLTMKVLGEKYNVNPDTIRKVLKRQGVQIRTRWSK